MANKKLNSIVWPNMPNDTYYLDAEKVKYDASETYPDGSVGKALQNKAEADGHYSDLTAGNAEQLVSNVRVNDKAPHIFRTSGGSVDIGDREYVNGITGVSLPWNQRVLTPTLSTNVDALNGSVSFSGGVCIAETDGGGNTWINIATGGGNLPANHVYLLLLDMMLDTNNTMDVAEVTLQVSWSQGANTQFAAPKGTWKTYSAILKPTSTINGLHAYPFAFTPTPSGQKAHMKNAQVIDLTQMFGSSVADYLYTYETATAGAGVAWFKKLFDKPYYAYNAGELKSVSGLVSHDMTGFNQWDEDWEVGTLANGQPSSDQNSIRSKNFCKCVPNTTYYCYVGSATTQYFIRVAFYDADKNFISHYWTSNTSVVSPSNAAYFKIHSQDVSGNKYGNVYKNDICINIAWDNSRNGEYEPYELHSYPLDSDVVLRGIPKLDANNNLYYDGDVYEADGTVTRKYGVVDLGSLTWQYIGSGQTTRFIANDLTNAKANSYIQISSKLTPTSSYLDVYNHLKDNSIIMHPSAGQLEAYASAYTDATAFKTAMNGVYLVYELATPTTEQADPYVGTQIVNDFGTEEYKFSNSAFPVPVGSDTDYPVNLVAKLEMAPNSPEGDGTYVVKQTNGQNEYVPLIIPSGIPAVPTTDGTYKLTVTVANGTPVLSWEA